VSATVAITIAGEGQRFVKEASSNPTNYGERLAFDITITGIESERGFVGTIVDQKGERSWRGKFNDYGKNKRGASTVELGPEDKSLQELRSITSLRRGAQLVDDKGKDDKSDMAQTEANRIFGRVRISLLRECCAHCLTSCRCSTAPSG
jgi:hypothetical protein